MIKIAKKKTDLSSFTRPWVLVVLALLVGGVVGYVIGSGLLSSSIGQAFGGGERYGLPQGGSQYPFLGTWWHVYFNDDWCWSYKYKSNGQYLGEFYYGEDEVECTGQGTYITDGLNIWVSAATVTPNTYDCRAWFDDIHFEYHENTIIYGDLVFERGECY